MPLQFIVTDAGRAAVLDPDTGGFRAVRVATVGVSPTAIVATPATAALPGEVKRIATIAGEASAGDIVHLTVQDESTDTYTVRSFALYLDDGTLFGAYGQADPIVEKSGQALLLLALDIALADIPAAEITFGDTSFINPPATTDRKGVVELATNTEATAMVDALRALTPANMAAIFTAAAILAKLVTVDGAGSGLDADLLDGLQGSAYAKLAGAAFTGDVSGRNFVAAPTLGPSYQAQGVSPYIHLTNIGATIELGYLRHAGLGGDLSIVNSQVGGSITLAIEGNAKAQVSAASVNCLAPLLQGGSQVWHLGNDGAGSGLDADLLDGLQGSAFAKLAGADFNGQLKAPNLICSQNPGVSLRGNIPYLEWANADGTVRFGFLQHSGALGNITLSNDQGGAIQFNTGGGNIFTIGPAGAYVNGVLVVGGATVWHAGNDGAGSGLDADLLDGQQGSWYTDIVGRLGYSPLNAASYTAADILAKLVTVDGAGSGVDADLLDGWHRDSIRDWVNLLNTPASFPPSAHTHGPADIAGAFLPASLTATSGYFSLPNGLIFQWVTGSAQSSGEGTQTLTLPVTFPNACLTAIAGTRISFSGTNGDSYYQLVGEAGTASVTVQRQITGSPSDGIPSAPRVWLLGN